MQMRRMLNITLHDKVRNSKIRNTVKFKGNNRENKRSKWGWPGHVARRDDYSWTKRLTEWQPRTGKEKEGIQKVRWWDEMTSFVGTTWPRVAQD